MNQAELMGALEETGAVMRGHFRLTSGRHSDLFVQKFRLLERPEIARNLGEEIAALFRDQFELVASPAIGAIVLGFATALATGARFIFSERIDGAMVLRRGFQIEPGQRVLVVEDVVTTGASAREVVDLVVAAGGKCVGLAVLIDRTDSIREDVGVPFKALVSLETQSWNESECPLCEEGRPLEDPGSRRLAD